MLVNCGFKLIKVLRTVLFTNSCFRLRAAHSRWARSRSYCFAWLGDIKMTCTWSTAYGSRPLCYACRHRCDAAGKLLHRRLLLPHTPRESIREEAELGHLWRPGGAFQRYLVTKIPALQQMEKQSTALEKEMNENIFPPGIRDLFVLFAVLFSQLKTRPQSRSTPRPTKVSTRSPPAWPRPSRVTPSSRCSSRV